MTWIKHSSFPSRKRTKTSRRALSGSSASSIRIEYAESVPAAEIRREDEMSGVVGAHKPDSLTRLSHLSRRSACKMSPDLPLARGSTR